MVRVWPLHSFFVGLTFSCNVLKRKGRWCDGQSVVLFLCGLNFIFNGLKRREVGVIVSLMAV